MVNIDSFKKYNHIHMIGIGGVSMSGIAEILKHFGIKITGSDISVSLHTEKLRKNNIEVSIGPNLDELKNSDLVVYTAAISDDNIELLTAKELNIPTIERGDFLGELTKCFKETIGVSGTHGKTTTTSMLSIVFLEAIKDPSIQVGAYLNSIDGNHRVGSSDYFIIEACEYVNSYLKLHPKSEVILNIDNDHLDYFKTFDNIVDSFKQYVALLPEDGLLVINGDDTACINVSKTTKATVLSYGINNTTCNFVAKNINFDDNGFPSFDVYFNGDFYENIKLSVPGKHNILNALACISVSHHHGIDKRLIKTGIIKYTGAHRRFEYKGTMKNNVMVFDDYGHHPTEVIAVSNALSQKKYNKSWVVFQPHTYSRTKNHLDDFTESLKDFDNIILLDIYAAREKNIYNISSKDLEDKLTQNGKNAIYFNDFEKAVNYIKQNVEANDIVLTLGAGTVTQIGPMLVK